MLCSWVWLMIFMCLCTSPDPITGRRCNEFTNTKTASSPEVATHPSQTADLVIGTDADFADHSYMRNGVLGGFDVELTHAVCATIGKQCAIVMVPWQSVWAADYPQFGWSSNPKQYPGEGHQNRWFHCVVGTRRLVARQQSIAFTHAYTDSSLDTAGFVVPDAFASGFPDNAAEKVVGLVQAFAATSYFEAKLGLVFDPKKLVQYSNQRDMWEAFAAGDIEAVFVDGTTARFWLSSNAGYAYVHAVGGWSGGVAYQCHPEYGDLVTALNQGLVAFKATPEYTALCGKYPSIACDTAGATFANIKTTISPETADHPAQRADIVVATEADFGDHNYIRNGVLGGFDVELTKAVCARVGLTCAIVTVPWQAVWTMNHSRFGWPVNAKNYPGEGHSNRWFHCAVGTNNLVVRQQSIAFTSPYTDRATSTAGFVVPDGAAAGFPADAAGEVVGVLNGWASSTYFEMHQRTLFNPRRVEYFTVREEMWIALSVGAIGAAFVDKTTANSWLSADNGFRLVHATAGWSNGVAYGCHPEYGDVVSTLNVGLVAFKATREYRLLCSKYPTIACDPSAATYTNTPTLLAPEIADHPAVRADIVIGAEADWGDFGDIETGVLRGFGPELTRAVCAAAEKACAIVTVPWEAVWPSDYSRFGWPHNPKNYMGEGHQNRWFRCSMNTFNIPARQQSAAFTHAYTDSTVEKAGFIVLKAVASSFPSDADHKIVGVLKGWGTTAYFESRLATFVFNPIGLVSYTVQSELWRALTLGRLDAVYVDEGTATAWLSANPEYTLVHAAAGWSNGVSYGCHPEYGDIVAALNNGLSKFKKTPAYVALCAKYPSIACDTSGTTFANVKTPLKPHVADHPQQRADIVIGTDAGFEEHVYIRNGVLGGFDVEFTQAVCAEAGKVCALVTMPWLSARPNAYARFGWATNPLHYPGEGIQSRWYHCSSGTLHLVARQQNAAFTNPYTDPSVDKAGFVVPEWAAPVFPPDAADRTVGVLSGWAQTYHFEANVGALFHPRRVVHYVRQFELWKALIAESIDAVYVLETTGRGWLSSGNGYKLVHLSSGWSKGTAYQCHAQYGDVVAALSKGIKAFKATSRYRQLCNRYPTVNCDCPEADCVVGEWSAWGACSARCGGGTRRRFRSIVEGVNGTSCPALGDAQACNSDECGCAEYRNVKTSSSRHIADHPQRHADIVIGFDADFLEHSYVRNGVVGGFGLELTNAVCAHAGKTCAAVAVPWQSVWPSDHRDFGWPQNSKEYPGEGHHRRWFHCAAATRNIVARQQSIAFTHPYTDPGTDTAGFIVRESAASEFPEDAAGASVGLLIGWAVTTYFQIRRDLFHPQETAQYRSQAELFGALLSGAVDALYLDIESARGFISSDSGYTLVHAAAGWSGGLSYGCHPEYGDVVAALNQGLAAFMATQGYVELCAKYPSVTCAHSGARFANVKTLRNPEIADHPAQRADIVVATEADFGDHNYIRNGVLGGFDIELTKAVCARVGKTCAVVLVPWQSVWTSNYSRFGWQRNSQNYPGEGHQDRWFHCAVGTRNLVARQQSVAFTSPYTDKTADRAGFVVAVSAATTFPSDAKGRVVGMVDGWSSSTFFLANVGRAFAPADVVLFVLRTEMWAALRRGLVDAVYADEATGQDAGVGFRYVHATSGWSGGMSYGCHPEYGDVVAALNQGLATFKRTQEYRMLCARYPGIKCDTAGAEYANTKTETTPEVADHPLGRADIVIGTEADWGAHNNIVDGVLRGFGIELTRAVCARADQRCAIVTIPWQSAWASEASQFRWPVGHLELDMYPGVGHQSRWFHCTLSTLNVVVRQQSIAFSHPYSDTAAYAAGFVVADAAAPGFPADAAGRKVALVKGFGATLHFLRQASRFRFFPADVVQYTAQSEMWAALALGAVDAVYADRGTADIWLTSVRGYQMVHADAGWSEGVAYGCHPEYGDKVAALNRGLVAFKATTAYADLCAKYPSVACDLSGATFANTKTLGHPATADHPLGRADIVVATAADFADHSYIHDGVLRGFDIELTKAVCAQIAKECAIVIVPRQSLRTADYSRFGWPRNTKHYPGEGYQDHWFHCAVGATNIMTWQQSTAFTSPYINRDQAKAGFVVPAAVAPVFPADAVGRTVGVQTGVAAASHFQSAVGSLFHPAGVVAYGARLDMWMALSNGDVEAVYVDANTANQWLSADNGYRLVHATGGWSGGLAFACHPGAGDAVTAPNEGLAAFKTTWAYNALCNKYPFIDCDCVEAECQVGEWTAWGLCSLGCGKGARRRTRSLRSVGLNGSAACPSTTQTEACSAGECGSESDPPSPGTYTFLFDGCPRGGLAYATPQQKVMKSIYLDLLSCERACDAAPACNMIEVNGCLKSPECWGQCWLFSGTGQGVRNGGCDVSGNQKTYLKPAAVAYHYLFDGCPSGGLVSRRYGVSLKSKAECERDCTIDPDCTAIAMTGCSTAHECRGQCALFSGAGSDVHNGDCVRSGVQKAFLKPSVHAECTPGRNPCAANARCRIVDGRFHCTCDPGTFGNGTTCETFTPTPTPAWTATSTARATRSPSPTRSSTPSITATATRTVMPTSTAEWSTCLKSPGAAASGPLQFSGTRLCTQALSLGSGSVSLRRRSVYLLISQMLNGELSLRFESGCPATAPGCPGCDACSSRFTTQHVGHPQLLPTASSSEISVVLLYSPSIAAGGTRGARAVPRAASGDVVAELYVVSAASPLLLLLLCLLTAVCVACALGLCWWHGHRFAALKIAKWKRNPRLLQRRVRAGVLVSAWAVWVGTIWTLAAVVTSDPEARPQALVCAGVAMAGAGAALLLGIGGWACWDGATYRCPVCQGPVSRFRYAGVYLPAPDGRAVAGKAHVAHVRCVLCARPVVWDPWPEAPPHRPWHMGCWQLHCERVGGDAARWERWCAAQGAALTDVELVHMFAAAIERGADPAVLQALRREPRLQAVPVAGRGGCTVMHLAARAGSVAVLQFMTDAASLAPYFMVDPVLGCSLSLRRAPDPDMADVYVHQPLLQYNGLPVYVGHTRGRYIYYYQPAPGDARPADAGWCLSAHLGSGKPKFRLLLDCATCDASARDLLEGLSAEPPEELAPTRLTKLKKKLSIYGTLKKKVDDCAVSMELQDPGPVAYPPDVACTGPMLTPKDLGLARVPHVRGLLDEAVASGDEATIRHVIRRHKDQYPQCLSWQYRAGDGLWQDYTPAVQSQISAALAQGQATLGVQAEGVACSLDLRALTHETASGGIVAIRSRVRPAFVCAGAVVAVVDAVGDWGAACVVDFGHLPARSQDRGVLALLHEEGVVDVSLVAPPCKDRMLLGTADEGRRQMLEDALRTELDQVLGHARPGADAPCLALEAFMGRSGRGPGRSARATGIGSRLNDGLAAPQVEDGRVRFYEPGYRSPVDVLPFCVSLAACPLGLFFELDALVEMATDAVMKLHELQRQRCALRAKQALAIYVYTYQLRDIDEPQDQIYSAMNTAMRRGDARGIAFWRPLIWAVDTALEGLPAHRGKLYRGINCQFDCSVYKSGHKTRWRAFSSASKSRAVAEEFSTGATGTLFFLSSVSAKGIAQYSDFPEEEEVLFQPNTAFSVTSTLQGSSDIGQFYSRIDNVAMEECGPGHVAACAGSEDASVFQLRLLVQGPKVREAEFVAFVESLAARTETITDRDLGVVKSVVLAEATPTSVPSPLGPVSFSARGLDVLGPEPVTPCASPQYLSPESPFHSDMPQAPAPLASRASTPEPEARLDPD